MPVVIILIVIAVVVACVIANNKRKELLNSGVILDRKIDFVKKAEIFTIKKLDDFSQITNGVVSFNYNDIKCAMDGDKAKQTYHFKGADWTADLWLVEKNDNHFVYRFEFGQWSERNGIPYSGIPMNKLATAIERLFVTIDPNASVRTEEIEFNTKRRMF